MYSKKGQIQINETILVIFIVTVIMLLGVVLFNRWTKLSIENEFLDNERIRFSNMLGTIPEMSELKCSSQGRLFNCLDSLKLLALGNLDLGYQKMFGFREIKVNIVYPETEKALCKSSTYPECNEFIVYSNKPSKIKEEDVIETPISLYYPDLGEYKIGILEIKWFIN